MNEQQVPTRVTLAVGNEFPEWELDGVAGTCLLYTSDAADE